MPPDIAGTDLWAQTLEKLKLKMSPPTFDTWIAKTVVESFDADCLMIRTPHPFAQKWLTRYYLPTILQAIQDVAGRPIDIKLVNSVINQDPTTEFDDATLSKPSSKIIDNTKSVKPSVQLWQPPSAQEFRRSELNSRYVFSRLVVGPNNQMAHAASLAVAESPGQEFNPLFLCGGVGLGKTHLMQAIGHYRLEINPEARIYYVSTERFTNDLVTAIRKDNMHAFREQYREVDVLLVDDIQFIEGKEYTQEEFFHTFNALYDGQKQIVLTSDCPPREIPEIEERLHSRFEWGLIADIEPPDLETKVAILRRKAELQRVDLPDDVALFLAGNSKHNIRELEGSLVRVLAMASLRGLPLSKGLAQEAMRNVSRSSDDNQISIPRIQKAVADHYKLSVDGLRSRSNMGNVLVPRQVAMYLCKRLTKKSYPEIARQFGGKHHTTVIHSVEKINKLVDSDREMDALVKRIISSIGA